MGHCTIKGLAKANECEEQDAYGLALIWNYWLECNCTTEHVVCDFNRLKPAEKYRMMRFLSTDGSFDDVFRNIAVNYFKK